MPSKHEIEIEVELRDILAGWHDDVRAAAYRLLYRDGWRIDENGDQGVHNVVRGDGEAHA